MGNLVQDLRYAFRTLRKAPLFTSIAVLSLALGIGANTAIFTLVNQLILQLLPVRDPEQLVMLTARGQHYGSNTANNAISYPMYQDFRDKNQVFQGMLLPLQRRPLRKHARRDPLRTLPPLPPDGFLQGMTVYARAQGDPTAIFAGMRQTVNQLDSNVPIYRMRTLEQQLDKSLMSERLLASLSGVFGLLATLLAAIGLYGVMAYMVVRRTREIGIRMALGANRGSVVWLVMREVLVLSVVGVALGSAAAYAATHLVQTQLFGILPTDAPTMALSAFGIATVAILSGYLPARRATAIDPMRALHWE